MLLIVYFLLFVVEYLLYCEVHCVFRLSRQLNVVLDSFRIIKSIVISPAPHYSLLNFSGRSVIRCVDALYITWISMSVKRDKIKNLTQCPASAMFIIYYKISIAKKYCNYLRIEITCSIYIPPCSLSS